MSNKVVIKTVAELKTWIGKEVAVGNWITVTQDMIDKFAEATGDHQFIHVDPERARQTPFGTTIAHGFLTLSLLPQLSAKTPDMPRVDGVKMGVNYGGNKVRFLAPVPSGPRVRGRSRLTEFAEKRPGQYQFTTETTVEIEGSDKPAMHRRHRQPLFPGVSLCPAPSR